MKTTSQKGWVFREH